MRASHSLYRSAIAAAALFSVAGAAQAQQANASAAAYGMAGNFTARARGYQALAWNPAMLGLSDNPAFSFGTVAISGSSGLDPVDLNAFAPYSNKTIPAATREAWLSQVQAKKGETGSAQGGVSFLGLGIGPFAVQVSSSVYARATLSPDAFEAIFFGNAGRTGTLNTFSFAGSSLTSGAFTTTALGYGHSLSLPIASGLTNLSFGVTGKYIIGNAVAMAQDGGSTMDSSSVRVNFPMVYSNPDSGAVAGSGYGMDVGLAWTAGSRLTAGVSIQNVVNTFKWNTSKLQSRVAMATFTTDSSSSQTVTQPYTSAPQTLRDQITNDKFTPVLAGGVAYQLYSKLLVTADAHQQVGDGIAIGPKTSVGAGLEYRGIPFIPLRGGFSYVTDGWIAASGLGIAVGPVEVSVAASVGQRNGARDGGIMLNVISIH